MRRVGQRIRAVLLLRHRGLLSQGALCDEPPAVPYLPPEGAGRRVVTAPTLPGGVAFGETIDEVMAREGTEVCMEDLLRRGE